MDFQLIRHPGNETGARVYGRLIDAQTRCTHYHSRLDIIAIKFKCCNTYYPCYECHRELAGHPAVQWQAADRDEIAVLCGACGFEMSIGSYLGSGNRCPGCQAGFNPQCSRHYSLYFEAAEEWNGV